MNLQEKGWIRQYLHIRNQYALQKEFERLSTPESSPQNPDVFLYQLLQPTGVLYGYPTVSPLQNKSLTRALRIESLNQQDKTKIILLESFLHSALTSPRYQHMESAIDVADATLEATHLIGKYYKAVYHGLDTRYRQWFFYKDRKGLSLSEYVLENKVNTRPRTGNFWGSFFNSSLMFLDIFYFGTWIHAGKSDAGAISIADTHEQMRLLILKVIVAAALANDVIEPEEKKLFDYFVEAAMFSAETKALCYQYLENPVPLEELKLQEVSSQILKKYVYELALLVIYADKLLTREEKNFIELLRQKLHLEKSEVESSQLSLESFMISHWQQMEVLQNPTRLSTIQQQVLDKIAGILHKNRDVLIRQVQSNHALLQLLQKAGKAKLSREEKNKVRHGLIDTIKAVPSTVLGAVPKSFFTYSILMQIIPEKIVPAANEAYPTDG